MKTGHNRPMFLGNLTINNAQELDTLLSTLQFSAPERESLERYRRNFHAGDYPLRLGLHPHVKSPKAAGKHAPGRVAMARMPLEELEAQLKVWAHVENSRGRGGTNSTPPECAIHFKHVWPSNFSSSITVSASSRSRLHKVLASPLCAHCGLEAHCAVLCANPTNMRIRWINIEDEAGRAAFEIDHIRPRSLKGTDDPINLQILCSVCNQRKGQRILKGDMVVNIQGLA